LRENKPPLRQSKPIMSSYECSPNGWMCMRIIANSEAPGKESERSKNKASGVSPSIRNALAGQSTRLPTAAALYEREQGSKLHKVSNWNHVSARTRLRAGTRFRTGADHVVTVSSFSVCVLLSASLLPSASAAASICSIIAWSRAAASPLVISASPSRPSPVL